jgi:small conductance mechanosensitive channel
MQWKDKIVDYVLANGPKLLGAALIIAVGALAARWIGKILIGWLSKRDLEPPVRMLVVRVVRLLVICFALMIALGTMGFNIMALVTGLGVAGVGVGLAMQGVLSNLVAGLTIIFTKPFRVGEYVEMVGVQGQVDVIELFTTTLAHGDRSRVVIPNRKIVGEVLHNYGTIRQLDLTVGVAYNTNIPETMAILRDVLKQNPRVLKELAPGLGVKLLAESAIELSVRPWVKVPDYGPAQGEIFEAIVERFRAGRIEIPFAQREVRLLNGPGPESSAK